MHYYRRAVWCGLAAALLACSIAAGDTIELFDGSRISTKKLTLDHGDFVLEDGRRISRQDCRSVQFGDQEAGAANALPASTAADVRDLLEKARAAREKYPDAGAIYLVDDGEFTLRPDGTQLNRTHEATLVLKEPWKSLGRISQSFEDGRQRATLVQARTICPDGGTVDFDPADLKESKPSEGTLFFEQFRTLSGQLSKVEVGCIVETIWENETYNPYDKELFFPRWYFAGSEPNVCSRATIRVPRGRELHYRVNNLEGAAAKPAESDEGDYHVYRWELHDLDPVISEPAMPPLGEVVPGLSASLFGTWDYLFDYLRRFQTEHTQVTPEIAAKVAEIVGDSTSDEEKLAKIYHWLQREVRYISVKGSMGSGWSGHAAALTLQNKFGDCIDKATLFATMLKAIHIQAEPVILATYGMAADDYTLPTLYGNHAITAVQLDGREFHLDCTGTSFRYPYFPLQDQGVAALNVLERRIERIEVPPPEDDALDVNLDMELDESGDLTAVAKLSMNGSIEGFARAGLEQINRLLRGIVVQQGLNSLCPGAQLQGLDVSDEADLTQPLRIELTVLLPKYATQAGDLLICELPAAGLGKTLARLTALDHRRYDILLASTGCLRQHISLRLPAGYAPKGLPDPAEFNTPFASYQARYELAGRTLKLEDCLALKQRRIPVEDYPAARKFVDDFSKYTKVPLFLGKSGRTAQ
jgi:transglutaminase-like putative cysteine protease